jgi:hypothetical protein
MKTKSLLSIMLIAGMAVIYTACKKSNDTSGPTLTPNEISTQVALDLTQSLYSGYGGFDLSGGLAAPGVMAVNHTKGRLLHDLSNPFCGLTIDTTLNAQSETENDTSANVSGHIYFSFTCVNDVLSGYTTRNDLSISISTPELSLASKINEDLVLLAIDPNDDNSKLSLKGTLNSSSTYNYKTGTKKSGTTSFNYILTSLVLNPDEDGDIISGSASFSTKGSGSTGSWSYIGTIAFTGNHKATITINGKAFKVNLQTGVVS